MFLKSAEMLKWVGWLETSEKIKG